MPKLITKAHTLEPHHIATIKQTAKDNGQSSDSAALRFIIDDWVRRLAEENNITNSSESARDKNERQDSLPLRQK